jgi:hypothetical protein
VTVVNFVDVLHLLLSVIEVVMRLMLTCQWCCFDDSDDYGGDDSYERTVSNVSQYRQLRQMLDSNWNEMT